MQGSPDKYCIASQHDRCSLCRPWLSCLTLCRLFASAVIIAASGCPTSSSLVSACCPSTIRALNKTGSILFQQNQIFEFCKILNIWQESSPLWLCAALCCAALTELTCGAGLCCCRWLVRRRANKKQLAYVNQYYNTVGYNQPAVDYAAAGAGAGSLTQNLKSDSMSSDHDLESMTSANPLFGDSETPGTGAAAGAAAGATAAAAAPGLMRTYSNASSEPRGPNPSAGWLNRDMNANNPLYQGDSTRAASAERPARRGRLPTDASPLTGMTTQPNRVRGRVGAPDRSILDS